MPRLPRQFKDEGIYHIIQRGNNKNKIFFIRGDYLKFISLLRKYKKRYDFDIFNYCLMPNHVHLLIKIHKKEHMAKLFQGIFQSFQYHHRRKYGYCGTLYQKRYKSILIDKDPYLLECARYIERNPLRASMVEVLSQYKWSSYSFYAENVPNDLLTPNPIYLDLAKSKTKRLKMYQEYLIQSRPYEMVLDQNIEKLR